MHPSNRWFIHKESEDKRQDGLSTLFLLHQPHRFCRFTESIYFPWHSSLQISLSAFPLRLKANVNLNSRFHRLDPERARLPSSGHGWNAMICALRQGAAPSASFLQVPTHYKIGHRIFEQRFGKLFKYFLDLQARCSQAAQ